MTNRPPPVSLVGTLKRMELNPNEWGWPERSSPAPTTRAGDVEVWACARVVRKFGRPAEGATAATVLRNERGLMAPPSAFSRVKLAKNSGMRYAEQEES